MLEDIDTAGLTEFELQRARLIARNRARLLALGIPEAVSGLTRLAPAVPAPKAKKPRAPKQHVSAEPTRHSNRLRDQEMIARGEVPPDIEPGSELAIFIIDGECPRCGKVYRAGHARHLDTCRGPPEPPTEEEIAAQAESYKSQQKEKLRQLELGGLVDYVPGSSSSSSSTQDSHQQPPPATAAAQEEAVGASPASKRRRGAASAAAAAAAEGGHGEQQQSDKAKQKGRGKEGAKAQPAPAAAAGAEGDQAAAAAAEAYATFIVIGSTGNHYVVKLTDTRRSCTCMDHRIRRRDCKHIRLIWEQLGIADTPQDWKQALERQLNNLGAAEEGDIERVREAEERRKARADKQAAAAVATPQKHK